jgi:hypothetical protein
LAVLLQLNGEGRKDGARAGALVNPPLQAQASPAVQPPPVRSPVEAPPASTPRRLKKLTIPTNDLVQWLLGQAKPPWLHYLPDCFGLEGCTVNAKNRQVTLTIRSKMFEPVAEGDLIPRIEWGE